MHRPFHLAVAAAFLLATHGVLVLTGFSSAAQGRLADGDSYMWLMRVLDLYASGDWYAQWQAQTNAPFGETLHWTRPFDTVLLVGALAGSLVSGFPAALWGWGMVVGPALLLAALPVWSWATRPLLDGRQFLHSVVLIALLSRIDLAFEAGRPDHQCLLGFLFVITLAGVLRLSLGQAGPAVVWVAGAAAGLALWTSIEGLIALVTFAGVLTVFWIAGWHRDGRIVAKFLTAAAAMVVFGLALQRPPAEWLTERYAQLAAPHGLMMIVAAMSWLALAWTETRSPVPWSWRRRASAAIGAGAVVVAVMAWVYPTFFAGPWVDYDVVRIKQWLPMIGEFQPVIFTTPTGLGRFLFEAGPVVIALGWCARNRRRPVAIALGLTVMVFLGMGMHQGRWLFYAQIAALLPWTLAIHDAMAWARERRPLATAAVFGLILGPIAAGGAVLLAFPPPKSTAAACAWTEAARHLGANVSRDAIVLSHSFRGPELAWFGGFRVVGAPYGHESIWETWDFFRAQDDATPRAIRDRRRLDYLLLCPGDAESRSLGAGDPASLYARLVDGKGPAWAVPEPLPDTLAAFRLYRVAR